MSVLSLLGSAAIGLVWGWLVGGFSEQLRHPIRHALALGAATVLLAAWIHVAAGREGLVFFLGMASLACLLHLAWQRALRTRFGALS